MASVLRNGYFLPQVRHTLMIPQLLAHQALGPYFQVGRLVNNRKLWHISKCFLFPLPARSTGLLSDIYYGNLSKLLWVTLTIFCGSPDDWVLRSFYSQNCPQMGLQQFVNCSSGFPRPTTGFCGDFCSRVSALKAMAP
uniref:Uncharacterized protein n=1 Tax=Pipistrellus kuhlii TaxID=59472 RepID=A0A7J7WLT7_PIPKU|nr:hypothetical protein mPipKuh1_007932 [Pipistrellus kuhlii]